MQKIKLYRYERPDGGVSVSPVQPAGEYTPMCRLAAAEGMALTRDGQHFAVCVDAESDEGWYEVKMTEAVIE